VKKLVFGCGYLGKRVATSWVNDGHKVFALTRSESRPTEWNSLGITPILGDVTVPERLPTFPNVDCVLYAVGFDRSATSSMREVYIEGLKNVMSRIPRSVKRFIYISSTSVYGQQSGEWIDEDSSCEPERENGKICLDAERSLEDFAKNENPPDVTILRLAGIYGPDRLLRRIEELKSPEIIAGNPDVWLNLIHVDDATSAVLACEKKAKSRRYLICDNRPVTRREFYENLARAVGSAPPQFAEDSAEDCSNLGKRCQNLRMQSELGFPMQFPTIAEGIPHAVGKTKIE